MLWNIAIWYRSNDTQAKVCQLDLQEEENAWFVAFAKLLW
jgi:hypothetical protein